MAQNKDAFNLKKSHILSKDNLSFALNLCIRLKIKADKGKDIL